MALNRRPYYVGDSIPMLDPEVNLTKDVLQYGATGLDVIDDTAAFEKALAYFKVLGRGLLRIPPGIFIISRTLMIPSNVTIRGSGSTILQAAPGLNAPVLQSEKSIAPFNANITLECFSIDGNRANQTQGTEGAGFKMYSVNNLSVSDVFISETIGHGLHINNMGLGADAKGTRFTNVFIDGTGWAVDSTYGSCFAFTSVHGLVLNNCHAYNAWKAGFRLSVQNAVLNGCVAKKNGNGGIVPVSGECKGLHIIGGSFNDNIPLTDWPCDGIRLVGAENVTINGVECIGNADNGIAILNGCKRVVVQGAITANNGQSINAVGPTQRRSGVAVFNDGGTACEGIILQGIHTYDNQGTPTQDYGIECSGSTDSVDIDNCEFGTNQLGPLGLLQSGNNVHVGRNRGLSIPFQTVATNTTITGTTATTEANPIVVKGNVFSRGSRAKILAHGSFTGASGTKTISVLVGNLALTFTASAVGSTANFILEVDLFGNNSTSTRVIAKLIIDGVVQNLTGVNTLTTAADWNLAVRGKLSVGTDSIVFHSIEGQRIN